MSAAARRRWVEAALFAAWAAVVLYVAWHHEFWRDEVRALSITRDATSPLDLLGRLRNEGHPLLWYVVLSTGRLFGDTPRVLPVSAFVVAAAAAALLAFRAPFAWWIKALWLFGGLAMYEYAVMARNYGLSMLLMFAAAALWRGRRERPWALAAVLALLANANAHSVPLALLLAGAWAWDAVAERRTLAPRVLGRELYLPLLVVLAGVAAAAVVAVPTGETVVTDARSTGAGDLLRALVHAATYPTVGFKDIVPAIPGPVDQAILYLAALGLVRRPPLMIAALLSQLALATFFDVVYTGGWRHQGLHLAFLVTLYWIALATPDVPGAWRPHARFTRAAWHAGLHGAVVVLLAYGVLRGWRAAARDVRQPLSASPALARFLREHPRYRDATVVPEPSAQMEALPYYAPNPIYLPREGRFGTTTSFTTRAAMDISLGALLDTARAVGARTGRPALVAIAYWDVETNPRLVRRLSYGRTFSYDTAQIARLRREAVHVADFGDAAGDERFRVYEVR